MSVKEFYMASEGLVAIKKSRENISLMLVSELAGFCDSAVMISLFEDIKKGLIAHYKLHCENQTLNNEKSAGLSINIPQSLLNQLTNRALHEKCSVDTLCVDYLSRGISGVLKR